MMESEFRPRFGILYVCTANLCRSVLAERLTRKAVGDRLGEGADRFIVESAGIQARSGLAMLPPVGRVLRRRGADTGAFASRRLSPSIVGRYDLVLTATTAQRDRVIATLPSALGCTFSLKEFARLSPQAAAAAPQEPADIVVRARSIVASSLTFRGQTGELDPDEDDIHDPASSRLAFRRCASCIARAVESIVDTLIA